MFNLNLSSGCPLNEGTLHVRMRKLNVIFNLVSKHENHDVSLTWYIMRIEDKLNFIIWELTIQSFNRFEYWECWYTFMAE